MTLTQLQAELNKLNKQIDLLIIDGKDYSHLTARHTTIWNLINAK